MEAQQIDRLVNTLLYEGYALYPYRPAIKNTQRWTFGTLFPKSVCDLLQGGDPWRMQAECLARGSIDSLIAVEIRFLQPAASDPSAISSQPCPPRQSAVERRVVMHEVSFQELLSEPCHQSFAFTVDGASEAVVGSVELFACEVVPNVYRVTAAVGNFTPLTSEGVTRETALPCCLASTHMIFRIAPGEFASLIDPPPELSDVTASCRNENCWPVLLGGAQTASTMLASPIILYDDPQVPVASHGDLFDATEIEEVLSLRILTLTPDEKQQMASFDERTRRMLERMEALAESELSQMHSATCHLSAQENAALEDNASSSSQRRIDSIQIDGQPVRVGDRVRLQPRGRADIFDLVLQGHIATVAAIEQDFEGQMHLAVCVTEDPGADLGLAGRIGHRFFFKPDEVELLAQSEL